MSTLARISLIVAAITLFIFASPVNVQAAASAISITPGSGVQTPNGTSTLTVKAAVVNGETLVRLDLDFTNITVLNFTPNTATFINTMPECGSANFTSTKVCISLASGQAIPANTTIGTISVRWGSSGTATIVATDNNLFVLDTTINTDAGTKATYTISNIPSTPLISADADKYLLVVAGVGVISLGLYLRRRSLALS